MWRAHKKCYITSQGKRWKFHKKLTLRRPGIEPRTTAWKAAMLTVTPSTLFVGQPSSIIFTWITADTKKGEESRCCQVWDSNPRPQMWTRRLDNLLSLAPSTARPT